MNGRLTAAAAIAVISASVSEFFLIRGLAWLITAIGAVIVVALAGSLTRLSVVPAAIGATVLGGLAAVPVLAAGGLWWAAAGAAVIVCCAASGIRWGLPRVVAGLITYLAALLLYLNAARAGSRSIGLFLPTSASLRHLASLASAGVAQADFAPPVAQTAGVVVLAAGSIGVAAIVVDVLAARLRRPAIAGVPLLMIYLAPLASVAHVEGPGAVAAFLIAAAGYLGLLASDGRARLRGWGRVISVWHRPGADERDGGADVTALAATGRRIGVAALCAAVIAPLLLPSVNLGSWFHRPATHVAGLLPDPVAQMSGMLSQSRPQAVLSYQSATADPELYLHVFVLNYDPRRAEWDLGPRGRAALVGTGPPLLPPPGLASTVTTTQATLRVGLDLTSGGYGTQVVYLPVPYWPERLTIGGSWRESADTLMIFSAQQGQRGDSYTVTSGQANPTQARLEVTQGTPPAAVRPYLGFASPVTSQLRAIALRETRGQDSAFGKAVALERWFHSGQFAYVLRPNLHNTPRDLLTFLTTGKEGFCEQFAFAMAVLARLLGIPSRVVIGYTAGTYHDGLGVVTTADAHSWPELYFTGVGWLRFEPTPGGTLGQGTAVEPAYVKTAPTTSGNGHHGPQTTGPSSGHSPGPETSTQRKEEILSLGANSSAPIALDRKGGSGDSALLAGLIAVAVLALAGVSPAVARIVTRRRRWRAASSDLGLARAAWREVRADLSDLGMPCGVSDSPRAVARQVCSAIGDDDATRQAIGRITAVIERAYYAPAPGSAATIRADVDLVRRSLASGARWDARWRARLLPASVLRPARRTVGRRLGMITGWVPIAREEATA